MSIITNKFTKEQLQQIEAAAKEVMWPVVWSEKKAREHFSEKITPKVVLKLARIALASLEAEPVAWLLSGGGAKNHVSFDSGNAYADPLREVTPLYTAPPAPVSVPAAMEMDDDFDSAFEHGKAVGWNAYRDAMLKHSEPFIVTSDHRMMEMPQVEAINAVTAMLQGVEPVTTANKLPFEQWLSQQTGTIDVECGCVMTEVFFHWLRVAYEAGNSPVIPDGWVACSERMPDIGTEIFYFCKDDGLRDCGIVSSSNFSGRGDAQLNVHAEGYDLRLGVDITHWMPLPAAPQQEVK
ncbi:DUF551 domain-containing protein [Enterobacter hormaechei]|uniref:DUF551 domain-containing protein n=1 Tax=Enterobacter hormaechei TaxID=158836 RepID=UPI0018C3103B|nr:DUF551 domain-containing protein [Enterobacter hormaechei]MBG0612513.1 DUF551 domain-containing protein [Enterobacter hormaechei]